MSLFSVPSSLRENESYAYDTSRFVVVSFEAPAAVQITKASAELPYLRFRVDLDPKDLMNIAHCSSDASAAALLARQPRVTYNAEKRSARK